MQSCLEIGSVWDFVLVKFPKTLAPSNLKYCFSKSRSIKFHLILELKKFPISSHICCHPETELPVSLSVLNCLASVLFPNCNRSWKKNNLSIGYCLIHILSTEQQFFTSTSSGLQREIVSIGGVRSFLKLLTCLQSSKVEQGLRDRLSVT